MPLSLVSKIAAESTESQALRQQLNRKLQTLERGLEICQRHRSTAGQHSWFHFAVTFLSLWDSHTYQVVEGHHTSLQDPDSPVSEASRHDQEAGDNESVMCPEPTMDEQSWPDYNRPRVVSLYKSTLSTQQ